VLGLSLGPAAAAVVDITAVTVVATVTTVATVATAVTVAPVAATALHQCVAAGPVNRDGSQVWERDGSLALALASRRAERLRRRRLRLVRH
jgi:hypothetical protein